MKCRIWALGAGLVCGIGGNALAQDWELFDRPADKAIFAIANFDSGIRLVSRCVDGDYELLITGLPESRRDDFSRTLRISVGDEPLGEETWTVGEARTSAFSRLPAPFARRLAVGGRLQIAVPGLRGQPTTRYVMELAPSDAALERTLTTCGRPLADPTDGLISRNAIDGLAASAEDENRPGLTWARPPRPTYPSPVRGQTPSQGVVTLTCLSAVGGHIESCTIESEHPRGYRLAESAVRGALEARLRTTEGDPPPTPRVVLFTTNFRWSR